MDSLPIFVKLRGERVILLGSGEGAEPKQRLLEAAGADVSSDAEAPARLAVVAIDDEEEAARTADALRQRGLLVNVVDKPALCDFSFPAIVDRSPVVIAIGTGGASATLSKTLRERLEALLPARLGKVAEGVRHMRRRVNASMDDPSARRRFWDRLMAPGAPLDPLAPADHAEEVIASALGGKRIEEGAVVNIPIASDDPDDLTLKQLRALSQADLVLSEESVPAAILDRARRDAERDELRGDAPAADGRIIVVLRKA